MESFDVIVIGVGAMGGSACCHLARRGLRVLGLEQFDLGHDRGSSHGQTRICRKAYFEHPSYVPLLHRAYQLWDELSELHGAPLLHRCGLLLAGAPDSEVIAGVRRVRERFALNIRTLAADEAAALTPGLRVPEGMEILFEADAGYLPVESCVRVQIEQARACGATLAECEPVRSWTAQAGGVRVRTERGEYSAGALVVTAGAWLGRMLAELSIPLTVRRKVQLWMQARRPGVFGSGCPVYAFDTRRGFFYGFPELEPGVVKVAEHTGGLLVPEPAEVDRGLHETDVAPLRAFVDEYMPGLSGQVVRHAVCLYTLTPDAHFVIDRHPAQPRVVFAGGFSGHGFKFAPIVGSILADLVVDGRTEEPAAFLGLGRLNPAGTSASGEPATRAMS